MTAQRRGHLLRAAVVGALVSGAVLLPAAPALADVNANPGQLTLKPGEEKQITVTLTGAQALNPEANISVNGLGNDVTLRGPGGCNANGGGLRCNDNAFDEQGNEQRLTFSISAKNPGSLQPGQNREGSINVDANGGDDSVNVTLQGPQQAASATEVNGTVTDQATGDGVPGAQVSLKDSAGNTHDATANNQGKYTIRPSNNKPIVAGQVTVTASKENFTDATANGTATAGRGLTLNLRMKPTAASAEPSAPVAAEPPPSTDPSGDASDVATPQNTSGDDEGPSMLSWALIGMGALLVLLGIGAIVLLVMRRKDDGDGDDPDAYGTNPQMAPAGAGAYGGDRTMVGGHSNANDQTAIVGPQQQLDEFPDPYAAPAPAPTRVGGGAYNGGYDDTQAGYGPGGGGDGGYGNGRGDGYGNGGGYRDDRGYGAQQGGYDEPRGGGGYGGGGGGGGGYADQATGVYQGGANGSEYGANGYGGGANGYGGGAGGGANGYGGGGYGGGANGGANGGGANGYGGGGYDEGDYGRRGGGGYQGQGGGYDRGGDYAGDPRNGRGRSNDWPE